MRHPLAAAILLGWIALPAAGQVRRFSPFSPEADSPVSVDLRAVAFTQSVFRGALLSSRSATMRAAGETGCVLFQDNDAPFTGLALTAGAAEVASTAGPLDGAANRWSAEFDLTAGITFNLFRSLNVDLGYNAYLISRAADDVVQEIYAKVSLDDADLWSGRRMGALGLIEWSFSIHPTLEIARELGGSRFGARNGTFIAFGADPSVWIGRNVRLAMPNGVALSLDRYYGSGSAAGLRFAYANVGPEITYRIAEHVNLVAGFDVEFLGRDAMRAGRSSDVLLVGRVGMAIRF